MNKRFSLLRALSIICTILLSGGGLTAAGSDSLYVVVLNDSAGSAQPDIPALGGEVLHQSQNRRVVRISAAGIRALAAHRGVKYIQRVEVDGSLPPLPFAPRLAATAVETNASPAPTWYSGEYVYDGDGNITAIGTAANQASDGGSEAYTYDSATRLVQAVIDHGTTDSEKYTYDSFGNLVDTIRTASPSTATPANPATNRLTGVTYDAVGNTLTEGGSTSYVWDGLNMMRAKVKSTETALYVYTADDERIGVFENGEQRWMIRDLGGKVLREWEVTGSVWMWREDHIYRNGSLTAAERETAEGGTRHFHLDHLGTPRLITDANAQKISQHDYFPFGLEKTDFRQEMVDRGTSWPEAMKFTGHERDFSGGTDTNNRNTLDYMHARYYSSVWGRFLAVDPGGFDPELPQSWNRYSYVLNNPLVHTDPDGREPQPRIEYRHDKRIMENWNRNAQTSDDLDRWFWRLQGRLFLTAVSVPTMTTRALLIVASGGSAVGATQASRKPNVNASTVVSGAMDGATNAVIGKAVGAISRSMMPQSDSAEGIIDIATSTTALLTDSDGSVFAPIVDPYLEADWSNMFGMPDCWTVPCEEPTNSKNKDKEKDKDDKKHTADTPP